MNNIGLSALLLACVAFILLPDVSQAESEHNLELLRKMQPLLEELSKDSSLHTDIRSGFNYFNYVVNQDLAHPSENSWVADYFSVYKRTAEVVLKVYALSDEAKNNTKVLIEFLGQLKKDEN